ncbi:MAG: hypothetical protein U5L11_06225 [Arhodomonas sp.]|nr:hypothetical protein [Arhodomonas sp.]
MTATNTSLSREGLRDRVRAQETGGLSGAPLRPRADRILATLHRSLDGQVPLIGVGGITRGEHAASKRRAGASLIQLYTGLIYCGPALVRSAWPPCVTRPVPASPWGEQLAESVAAARLQ